MTSPERRRGFSLRWQLTLSYTGFLLLAGLVFVLVGLAVIRFVPEGNLVVVGAGVAPGRQNLIDVYLRYSAAGIAALGAIGMGAGWVIAGRVLRRMRTIMDVVIEVQRGNFQKRVAMHGRRDELSALADTFDLMLARVQTSLEEHQRFSANASHELRTPHAVMRTILEVARKNPARDIEVVLERLSATNERAISLTESLLSLAAAEAGAQRFEVTNVATLARRVLTMDSVLSHTDQIALSSAFDTAWTVGDPVLMEQLIVNLVRNALVHNHPGGAVEITTTTLNGEVVLEVTNTGPVVPPEIVATLTEPFARAERRTRAHGATHVGAGLGLAIVASIVRTHQGRLTILPQLDGGLNIRVSLPAAPSAL